MKIITARYLLPLDQTRPVSNGAMAIDGDKICAVGTLENVGQQFAGVPVHSFPDCILMPGFVNAHCHLDRAGFYSRYSVSTPTTLSATSWFIESMQYLSSTPVQTITHIMSDAIDRQLDLGVTCLGTMNHYEGTYPLMKEKKIRGVAFTEIFSAPNKHAQTRFEIALALLEKYQDNGDRVKMGLGPFAPYLLSKNLLNIIARHAKDSGLPLQIHVAENFSEMEFFFDSKGPIAEQIFPWLGWEELPLPHQQTPIQYLDEIRFLATPTSIVGGYHLSHSDFDRLARNKTVVTYCPTSQKRFNHGRFPYRHFKKAGVTMALGTDFYSETDGFNLWEEMRLALKEGCDVTPSALDILQMATVGGSTALGLDAITGSLEAGKQADYLLVECPAGQIADTESFCRLLIEQSGGSRIRRAAIGGNIVRGT